MPRGTKGEKRPADVIGNPCMKRDYRSATLEGNMFVALRTAWELPFECLHKDAVCRIQRTA